LRPRSDFHSLSTPPPRGPHRELEEESPRERLASEPDWTHALPAPGLCDSEELERTEVKVRGAFFLDRATLASDRAALRARRGPCFRACGRIKRAPFMNTRAFRLLSLLPIAALALSALCSTSEAAAEEPTIDQIEYHPAELPPEGARPRVILVGAALAAGWYGAAVGTSYLWSDAPNAKDLRLPVVGPWLALGDVGCGSREGSGCSTVPLIFRTAIAVVSGVGQAGGLFAIVEGLVMDTDSSPTAPAAPREKSKQGVSWSAAPVMLSDGAGIELFGQF
jgi:hypothetical protein